MHKGGATYIITNQHHTVLYIGSTSDLKQRIHRHRVGYYPQAFSLKYSVYKLVYHEGFPTIKEAINREYQLKAGPRKKKIELINTMNPQWRDLYEQLVK